jgi:hypothetical protein
MHTARGVCLGLTDSASLGLSPDCRSKRELQHWKDIESNPRPTVWTIDWLLSKLTGDQLAGDKLAVRTRPRAALDVPKACVNTICTSKSG